MHNGVVSSLRKGHQEGKEIEKRAKTRAGTAQRRTPGRGPCVYEFLLISRVGNSDQDLREMTLYPISLGKTYRPRI